MKIYEHVNEDRVEKLHRVKFVKEELDVLEPAKNEAEAYLKLEGARMDKHGIPFAR